MYPCFILTYFETNKCSANVYFLHLVARRKNQRVFEDVQGLDKGETTKKEAMNNT